MKKQTELIDINSLPRGHFLQLQSAIKKVYKYTGDERVHEPLLEAIAQEYNAPYEAAFDAFVALIDEGQIKHPSDPGHIYVLYVCQFGCYKIGKTKDIDKRTSLLDIQLPYPAELIKEIYVDHHQRAEKKFHELFKDKRMNGEWFKLTEEDLLLIDKTTLLENW